MSSFPVLVRTSSPTGETRFQLGHPLIDSYLEFVAGRARPNTLRAIAFDLKAFFTVVDKDPLAIVPADVFEFLADQRGDRTVVRLSDGESGLSARTIARRLSSVSGFYAYLVARGDTPVETNPVPKGLSTRRICGVATPGPVACAGSRSMRRGTAFGLTRNRYRAASGPPTFRRRPGYLPRVPPTTLKLELVREVFPRGKNRLSPLVDRETSALCPTCS